MGFDSHQIWGIAEEPEGEVEFAIDLEDGHRL